MKLSLVTASVRHSLEFKYLGAFESFRIALGHEMGKQVAWFLETSSKQKIPCELYEYIKVLICCMCLCAYQAHLQASRLSLSWPLDHSKAGRCVHPMYSVAVQAQRKL